VTPQRPSGDVVMNHYLVTLPLSSNVHMHCYLLCKEGYEATTAAAEKMFQLAEDKGIKPWPAIVLSTKLDSGVKIVRKVVSAIPEVKDRFKVKKDFHCIIWCMYAGTDEKLMALH
jgi:hypothetical protein